MKKLYILLVLITIFALSGCNKESQIESPEVVLQKVTTQGPKRYQTETDMRMNFQVPSEKIDVKTNYQIKGKSDVTNPEKFLSQSQTKVKIAFTHNSENPEDFNMESDQEMKWIGNDLYLTYKKYDLKVNGQNLQVQEGLNAIMPIFMKPYLNKHFHVSTKNFKDIIEPITQIIELKTGLKPDLKAIKSYNQKTFQSDLAKAKLLNITKNFGLEEIKTLTQQKAIVYHYKLKFEAKGFENLTTTLNNRFKLIDSVVLDEFFEKGIEIDNGNYLKFQEAIELLNNLLNIEIWVGKKNYAIYKMEVKISKDNLLNTLKKIKEINPSFDFDEGKKIVDEMKFVFDLEIQNEETKPFTIERPEDKVIDYSSMFQVMIKNAKKEIPEGSQFYYEKLNNIYQKGLITYDEYNNSDFSDLIISDNEVAKAEIEALEKDRKEKVAKLKRIYEKITKAGGWKNDSNLSQTYLLRLENFIKNLEDESKTINQTWLKIINKEIPMEDGMKKIDNLTGIIEERDSKYNQAIEEALTNFEGEYNIDPYSKF